MVNTIEHCTNTIAILENLRRSLRPGGHLVLAEEYVNLAHASYSLGPALRNACIKKSTLREAGGGAKKKPSAGRGRSGLQGAPPARIFSRKMSLLSAAQKFPPLRGADRMAPWGAGNLFDGDARAKKWLQKCNLSGFARDDLRQKAVGHRHPDGLQVF